MRRVTEAEAKATHAEITEIRKYLKGEADLLTQTHDKRLVMYAAITTAIHIAHEIGFSPDTFAQMVAATLDLYTAELPEDE